MAHFGIAIFVQNQSVCIYHVIRMGVILRYTVNICLRETIVCQSLSSMYFVLIKGG